MTDANRVRNAEAERRLGIEALAEAREAVSLAETFLRVSGVERD